MTIDTTTLLQTVDLVAVAGKYSTLKRQGREHVGLCPFHSDSKPSWHVIPEKGFATCMACGWHGDAIAIVRDGDRVSFKEACERLGSDRLNPVQRANTPKAERAPDRVTRPPPVDAAKPNMRTRQWGAPVRVWEYRDAAGALLFYVARYNLPDGSKVTPQWTWGDRGDGQGFRWGLGHYQAPRPLYGLDRLAQRPKAPVLIVEGEKDADAAQEALDVYVVVTWPGGTNGVEHVDFSPLAGRTVVIWPDQDLQKFKDDHPAAGMVKPTAEQPGTDAANRIAAKVHALGVKTLKVIDVTPDPDEPPKDSGWACSDAVADGMETWDIIEWLKPRARVYQPEADAEKAGSEGTQHGAPDDELADALRPSGPPPDDRPSDRKQPDLDDSIAGWPFRVLGYNRGIFHYLPNGAAQIKELSARAHQTSELLELAPLSFWESHWPREARSGGKCDWTAAADSLIRAGQRRGIFTGTNKVRGRGAWVDEGRAVFHLGDFLLVDGQPVGIADFKSRFVYEVGEALNLETGDAATNKEAFALFEICQALRWESQLSAYLFAGWCVISAVCGILKWRPHAWIVGPSGSGKSTVLGIVDSLLGTIANKVEAGTSAAGITGTLTTDALPILFDEAESDNDTSRGRMQGIMELARVSASGGKIVKGTRTGGIRTTLMRSSMMFSSINPMLDGWADESRFTQLPLSKNEPKDEEEKSANAQRYEDLQALIMATLTPEFSARLLMRTLDNLVTLQKNVDTFARAATLMLGGRRVADQIAPMLAGCYLLHNTGLISPEAALEWIKKRDFTSHTATASERDHESMLSQLLQFRVRWTAGNHGQLEKTIGELIRHAVDDGQSLGENAVAALARYGFKVDHAGAGLWISTTHHTMRKEILKGARSSAALRLGLKSIDGAKSWKNNVRFAESSTPAIWLPLASVLGAG